MDDFTKQQYPDTFVWGVVEFGVALYGMLGWLERLASDEKYFEKKDGARDHLKKVCWLDPPSGYMGL